MYWQINLVKVSFGDTISVNLLPQLSGLTSMSVAVRRWSPSETDI